MSCLNTHLLGRLVLDHECAIDKSWNHWHVRLTWGPTHEALRKPHCRGILVISWRSSILEASQFWRLENQDQGVDRLGSFWEQKGRLCPTFSPSSCWLAGTLCRHSAWRCIPLASASVLTWCPPFLCFKSHAFAKNIQRPRKFFKA